jgi:hypothetical protein
MLSPTAMSSCARKLKLSRTLDYYAEPRRLYWATRGALYHAFLETELSGVEQERRVYKSVTRGPSAPWLLSGRIDYYDRSIRAIEDFKTKADKGIFPLYKDPLPSEQYIWQLNIYRWLLHGGRLDKEDGLQIFWPVDTMQIHFIFMNRVVSTGQRFTEEVVQKGPPNAGKKYRNEVKGSRRVVGKTTWGYDIWNFDVQVPAIPIYDFKDVEDYLIEHGPERRRGLAEPDFMPEGVMNDPDKSWECGYCDVVDECKTLQAAKAISDAQSDDGLQNVIL